jgi:hypothetical protein
MFEGVWAMALGPREIVVVRAILAWRGAGSPRGEREN